MTDSINQSSFEAKVKKSYQATAPDHSFAKALRVRLAVQERQSRERRTPQISLAGRLAMAVGACALALTLLFVVAPQSEVALGMRQLFGFIPGVGIVEEGALLRQLDTATAQTRDGITVSIDQMILSPDLTAFSFQVSGVPESAYPLDQSSSCGETPYLRLPDGGTIKHTGLNAVGKIASGASYKIDFVLSAVPSEMDSATLVMPCVLGLKDGSAPVNWEFPLSFVPVSAEFVSKPVKDVVTAAEIVDDAESKGPYDDLFTLEFDQRVSMTDGDILFGKIFWKNDSTYYNPTMEMEYWTDGNSNRIITEWAEVDPSWNPLEKHDYTPYAIFIPKTDAPGPYTLNVDSMRAIIHLEDVCIDLDVSVDPEVGQQWVVNKSFQAGDFMLNLVSVTRIANGYEIVFDNPEEVGCVDLSVNQTSIKGECGQNYTRFVYNGEVPTGTLNIGVHNVDVRLKGNWDYTWMP